jgi:hypothetical protein
MALATYQHTSIEWNLIRLFDYLRLELGKKKKRALDEMEYRRLAGHLKVIVREYDADGNPKGKPFDLGTDKKNKLVYDRVWVHPLGLPWGDFRCTVTEQNVRDLWSPRPPASLPAPDRQPEDKAGPDPSEKPKETLETRLINLMAELQLKSGMFPREVRATIKRNLKKPPAKISAKKPERSPSNILDAS